MSNIQAALGCAQLKRIEELVVRKREIFHAYKGMFDGLLGVSMNPENTGDLNSYWMPTLVFGEDSGISRDLVMSKLISNGVEARTFFWPLSSLDFMENSSTNHVSKQMSKTGLNLPSFHEITHHEQQMIATIVLSTVLNPST
jgi:perosamine synthetase